MTHALNIVWNPSEGRSWIFHYSLLQPYVCNRLCWMVHHEKHLWTRRWIYWKLDSLFIWSVLATLIGARLGHVLFYDWEYFRNHLLEIFLPVRFSPTFEFTGFQGLASHGAAISIIVAMYFFSKKYYNAPTLDLRPNSNSSCLLFY
jgi:prolipoprotein diacylglyceryltransferase